MKSWLPVAVLLAFAGCTTSTGTTSAGLIGTHDLVFVDQLGADRSVARLDVDGAGTVSVNGLPSRFLFVTSADTNELRVLELFKEGNSLRSFLRGPNPLETLSIPVLGRPTMLAADEGRNTNGQRVTGSYVYAARPGGAEVSIVSVTGRRQLGGGPVPVPAGVTAIGASMQVGPDGLVPAMTQLFLTTWDGSISSVYRTTLDTNPEVVDAQIRAGQVVFTRLAVIEGTPVQALLVAAPLAGRTNDGAPFCDTQSCLAIATRPTASAAGRSLLFDPTSGRSVALSFTGPIRKFAAGAVTSRLYGLLDEVVCGRPSCGGVVAVDLATATTVGGFSASKNVIGLPFGPLRTTEALITGLTIGQGAVVQQLAETKDDAGTGDTIGLQQRYDELGAYASSDGLITYFSGNAGSVIDFDGRRATITSATIRSPGVLPDGGVSFTGVDGGAIGEFLTTATVDSPTGLAETFRRPTVTLPDGVQWSFDISDGYFVSQDIVVANRGQIPGLVSRATSAADDTHLVTSGFEVRALVGDTVIFEVGSDELGFAECGRGLVAGIGSGFVEVDAVPAGCGARVRFSVRAGPPSRWSSPARPRTTWVALRPRRRSPSIEASSSFRAMWSLRARR